eukprot:263417_1
MAEILVSKIDVVVNGYIHNYIDDLLVVYLVICYINGDEGVISINYDDIMAHNGCSTIVIAQQCKSEGTLPANCDVDDCLNILKYVYTVKPTRRQFCVDMTINYNCRAGYACKRYQYIENQITEGLEQKTNDVASAIALHDITDPRYPIGLHLNLFTDKSRHEQLFKLLTDTHWCSVHQFLHVRRNGKYSSIIINFSSEMLVGQCKKSFECVDSPLIPVIIEGNNSKWIEWLKIVHIHSNNIYVGDIAIS